MNQRSTTKGAKMKRQGKSGAETIAEARRSGEVLVGRDVHGEVAVWSAKQQKMIDARYASNRDRAIAIASIGGRSHHTIDRGGVVEQQSDLADFADYLEVVGK